MGSTEEVERVVVRHALARGYVTSEQVREAALVVEELRRAGRPAGVLAVLRARALRPEHVRELQGVWQAALVSAGVARPSGVHAVVLPAAGEVPAEVLARSREASRRAPEEGAETVRAFLEAPAPREAARPDDAATIASPGPERRPAVPAGADDERARLVEARKKLGHFVLLAELGRGGMGVVHRAWDEKLRREVALKTILPQDEDGARAVERFYREAEAVARLRHPAIVSVHEVGEVEGRHFIAMDLVPGTTLAKKRLTSDRRQNG